MVSVFYLFQESLLVNSVVRRLLLNYITRPRIPLNSASYPVFSDSIQPGVLQRVGSAAGMLRLLIFVTLSLQSTLWFTSLLVKSWFSC